jgi:Fe-S cluster biogenesis protein NfuA
MNFVLEVNLNGTTRFKEMQERGLLLDEYDNGRRLEANQEHILRRALQKHTTLPTTKKAFLDAMNDFLKSIPHISAATRMADTQPLFISDKEEFKNVTLLFDLEVQGFFSQATEEDLEKLVDYVIASYNFLKLFGDTCDSNCLSLLSGNATIDTDSIQLAGQRRALEETSDTPVSITLNPSIAMNPTKAPTEAPTFRGVDRFTILMILKGTCRGCSNNVALFNQVVGRQRQLDKDTLANVDDFDFDSFLEGNRNLESVEECLCPVNALEGKPTEEDMITLLQDRAQSQLGFIQNVQAVVETEKFPCNSDQQQPLYSNILIKYEGSKVPETSDEIAAFENYVGWAYNKSSENVCDVYSPLMSGVQLMEVTNSRQLEEVQDTGSPSTAEFDTLSGAPSIPFVPTVAPTQRPTFRGVGRFSMLFQITGSCNGCPNGHGYFNQVVGRRAMLELGPSDRSFGPVRRLDEENDICTCDKELFRGSVLFDDFTNALLQKADEFGITNVLKIQETVIDGTSSPTISI